MILLYQNNIVANVKSWFKCSHLHFCTSTKLLEMKNVSVAGADSAQTLETFGTI